MMRLLRFVLAISAGIARDQGQRRRAISALLIAVLGMLFCGVFPLWNVFAAHPLFFAIFWLLCAWLTTCVLLLAIYDLLMVVRRGREERAAMRRRIFKDRD
ncbi:MAG: hypothetical protein PHC88_13470 [Terrimicrobiaceae bacterium]|nr:hypothetical protein [Terrimicrobiaceae bacterium]